MKEGFFYVFMISKLYYSNYVEKHSVTENNLKNVTDFNLNFMVTPFINNIQHFNFQLTHTMLKNVELLKYFKISKTALTCFGLQGNHHQGATIST